MPLLSSKLPQYSGKYDVGTIDIEAPCDKRLLSSNILKETGQPAFRVDTVLFSLYYPAVKGATSKRPHHRWVPKPLALHGEGYARFAKMNNVVMNKIFTFALWSLVGNTVIPAKVDVPILGPVDESERKDSATESDQHRFPVIVFSHGMASCRTGYTQYCAELAARGYIVAAVEHRDGSGPGTLITDEHKTRKLLHFGENDLEPSPDIAGLKALQLTMRQAEIQETVRVLQLINDGRGAEVFQNNPQKEGHGLAEWKGVLNLEQMIIGGHSYGATLALQSLRTGPSPALPFVGCVALDPGKQSGPLNDDIHVPLVVVHSQSWSAKHTIFHGAPHFSVVKDLVRKVTKDKKKPAWFTTARGTTHPSVTDAPLIEPFLLAWTTGATINAKEGVLQYVQITAEFMTFLATGRQTGILSVDETHPEYDQDIRSEERKAAMDHDIERYWQIHVAPSIASLSPT